MATVVCYSFITPARAWSALINDRKVREDQHVGYRTMFKCECPLILGKVFIMSMAQLIMI